MSDINIKANETVTMDKVTKSQTFMRAHEEARQNSFGLASYRSAFRNALRGIYADLRRVGSQDINAVKDAFWSAWKRMKNHTDTGARNAYAEVVDRLSVFTTDQIRDAFGRYADWVIRIAC